MKGMGKMLRFGGKAGKAGGKIGKIGKGIHLAADLMTVKEFVTPSDSYSVQCHIIIHNLTKYDLCDPRMHLENGELDSVPMEIGPKKDITFVAHDKKLSPFGTWGIASWAITGMGRRVVVMWSCPSNSANYSNWLAVGITTSNMHHKDDWLREMYYNTSIEGLKFERAKYSCNLNSIDVDDGEIYVKGIMGSARQTTAEITVGEKDLAM